MAKVFLIQETRDRDLTSAREYGTIVPIFAAEDAPGQRPVESLQKLHDALRNFGDDDYVAYSGGDWAGLLLAGVVLANLGRSKFNYLRWERDRKDRSRGYYVPVTVDLAALQRDAA